MVERKSLPLYSTGADIMAIISGFADGRGKPNDRLTTLSVLVGDDDSWRGLQQEWAREVNSLLDGKPLSVTDCLSERSKLAKIFTRETRMKALVNAVTLLNKWTVRGITAYSSSVDLDDLRRVKVYQPGTKDAEEFCVDDVIPKVEYQFPEPASFDYFFDQGERFLRYVKPFWKETPTRRAKGPYYMRRIEVLASASDARIPIQCADVYTYVVHTFIEIMHLGVDKRFPEELVHVVSNPSIGSYWKEHGMQGPQATNRVLASTNKVPN